MNVQQTLVVLTLSLTNDSLILCNTANVCCVSVFGLTKRIEGRLAA